MGLLDSLFKPKYQNEAARELLKKGALVIDVRTPGEFQAGHTKDAVNYQLNFELAPKYQTTGIIDKG